MSNYAKVIDGLYIGNCTDNSFLTIANISAIINVAGKPLSHTIDVFDYTLPSQELLDSEIPKTINKLDTICQDIKLLLDNNRNVLIYCGGKNKSPLIAGYYLIKYCGWNHMVAISTLKYIYMTKEQKEELSSTNSTSRKHELGLLECLTMGTFCKVLRIVGAKK